MTIQETGSKQVTYAALAGNFAIAVAKYAAAWWTGSSAMLSEAIHSTVNASSGGNAKTAVVRKSCRKRLIKIAFAPDGGDWLQDLAGGHRF